MHMKNDFALRLAKEMTVDEKKEALSPLFF